MIYESIEAKFESALKERTELNDMLNQYLDMPELFRGDEKLISYSKRFNNEFVKGFNNMKDRCEASGVHPEDDSNLYVDNTETAAVNESAEKEEAAEKKKRMDKEAAEKQDLEKQKKEEAVAKEAAEKKKRMDDEAAKRQALQKEKKEKAIAKEAAEKEQAEKKKKEEAEKKKKEAAEKKKKEAEKKVAEEQKKIQEEAEKKAAELKNKQTEEAAAAEKEISSKKENETTEVLKSLKNNILPERNDEGVQNKNSMKLKEVVNILEDQKKKAMEENAKKKLAEKTTGTTDFQSPEKQEQVFGIVKEDGEIQKGKRQRNKSKYLVSPYNNKMVKTQDKLDEVEILCSRSVFSMLGNMSEVVFDDAMTRQVLRKEIQTLAPGCPINKHVIDTLVTVLNYEDKVKSAKKPFKKLYFPTDVVKISEETDLQSFEKVIEEQLNSQQLKKKMKDVELAFFPTMHTDGQYYVIVFNLLKATAVILDNQHECNYDKYKDMFELVKKVLLQYFEKYKHPCVDKLSKSKEAKVMKLSWKTKENKIDSGLYTMMHMELYQGESASKWKTEIVPETNLDYKLQIKNMRIRFTTKILMHEMNTKRGDMAEHAKSFSEKYKDEKEVAKMIEEAIAKRIKEVNSSGSK